jgi:DNA invertase Pin-like site-specific DNA recombinase
MEKEERAAKTFDKAAIDFIEQHARPKTQSFDRDQALAAARLHHATLVVAKVDRLTRSVAFLSRLLEAGVDVRFVDLPQIEGPTGRFMLHMMASVAELEAATISTRIKAALAQAKRRGVVLGGDRGHVPSKAHRALAAKAVSERADARAADVMPSINQLRASGATSLRAIAAGLNEQKIPTARGRGQWSATHVMNVLKRHLV